MWRRTFSMTITAVVWTDIVRVWACVCTGSWLHHQHLLNPIHGRGLLRHNPSRLQNKEKTEDKDRQYQIKTVKYESRSTQKLVADTWHLVFMWWPNKESPFLRNDLKENRFSWTAAARNWHERAFTYTPCSSNMAILCLSFLCVH